MITYKDRMRYMELLDNIKVADFNIHIYEQWREKILLIIYQIVLEIIFINF